MKKYCKNAPQKSARCKAQNRGNNEIFCKSWKHYAKTDKEQKSYKHILPF